MQTEAAAGLWQLTQGQPYVDAGALADAIVAQVRSGDLDYRTRLLIRDGLDALEGHWGTAKTLGWLAKTGERNALTKLWREPHERAGFPFWRKQIMDAVTPEKIESMLREVGSHLRKRTSAVLGESGALILSGLVSRETQDLDFVDEVPAELRNDHAFKNRVEGFYRLQLSHFQHHYLPSGWKDRTKSLGVFGNLALAVADPHDIFLGKLTSIREKDLQDLHELKAKLDKATLVDRLKSSMESTFASDELKRRATQNWYVLYGEELPT